MGKAIDYHVVRQHLGDRVTDSGVEPHMFLPGETRTADPATVGHLVGTTLIRGSAGKAQ